MKQTSITFTVTPESKSAIQKMAKSEGVSLGEMCRDYIELMADVPQKETKGLIEIYERLAGQRTELVAKIKAVTEKIEVDTADLARAVEVAEQTAAAAVRAQGIAQEQIDIYEANKAEYVNYMIKNASVDQMFKRPDTA